MKKVNISDSWYQLLEDEFKKDYFRELAEKIRSRYKTEIVYPHPSKVFNAFNMTPLDKVKAIIIGQDPYHGPKQANGLCFSVEKGLRLPPSLKNIYKELESDLDIKSPSHGSLENWALEGVLLLNTVLTVEKGKANSHQKYGWEIFTDTVVKKISKERKNIVFILWGRNAQEKGRSVDREKHLVLEAAHPSPLSAYNGFWGYRHFSKANQYLKSNSITPINWNID